MQDITHKFDLTGATRFLQIPNDVQVIDTNLGHSVMGQTNHADPRRVIYVDTEQIRHYPDDETVEDVIAHELVHLAQFFHYGGEQIQREHMLYSYDRQPHEIEARELAPVVSPHIRRREWSR